MTPNIQFNRSAIDAGGAVSQGWEMVKANYGIFLGVSLVALVLSGCIPCVSLFVMGPVLAGVYYFSLRLYAGEPVEFGMMFKGFEKFLPLMIIGIIQSIPEIIGQGLRFGVNLDSSGWTVKADGGTASFSSRRLAIPTSLPASQRVCSSSSRSWLSFLLSSRSFGGFSSSSPFRSRWTAISDRSTR